MKRSIATKLMLYMVGLTLLCTVFFTIITSSKIKEAMLIQMHDDGKTLISIMSDSISDYTIQDLVQIQKDFKRVTDTQNITYISIADENLNILVSEDTINNKVILNQNEQVDTLSGATQQGNINKTVDKGEVSGFIFQEEDGEKVYNLSAPVVLKDNFKGVLNIGISLEQLHKQLNNTMKVIFRYAVVLQLLAVGVAWAISQHLIKNIKGIIHTLKCIEEKDFTKKFEVKNKGEIAILAKALNTMLETLRRTLGHMKQTAVGLNGSVHILADTANNVFTSSTYISEGIEQITTVMEGHNHEVLECVEVIKGFGTKIDNMTLQTQEVLQGNKEVGESADEAYNTLQGLVKVIGEVGEEFTESMTKIERLEKNIIQIDEMSNMITQITEQTNLLALNASIEAARAGEEGRGFTVVATEMRRLSDQVKDFSLQISEVINQTQENMGDVNDTSERIAKHIVNQVTNVNETALACQLIQKNAQNNTLQVHSVENELKNILEEKEALIKNVHEMAEIATQITATTQSINSSVISQTNDIGEVSKLGTELTEIAETLREIAEEFKM